MALCHVEMVLGEEMLYTTSVTRGALQGATNVTSRYHGDPGMIRLTPLDPP